MNNYQKVRPGDSMRISAGVWNDILDVVKAHKNQKDNLGVQGRGVGRGTFILVKNDTGADLDRFDAVALSAPIITPTANETEFLNNFAMVGSSEGTGRAVFQEPVANGKIGRAMVMGITPMRKAGAIIPSDVGTVLWDDDDWALVLLSGAGLDFEEWYPGQIIEAGEEGTWNIKLCTVTDGVVEPYGGLLENQPVHLPHFEELAEPQVGDVAYFYQRDGVWIYFPADVSGGSHSPATITGDDYISVEQDAQNFYLTFDPADLLDDVRGDGWSTAADTSESGARIISSILEASGDAYISASIQTSTITGHQLLAVDFNIDVLYAYLSFNPPPGWAGPPGPQGPQGPQGSQGPPGEGGVDVTVVTAEGEWYLHVDENIDEETGDKTYTLSHRPLISEDNSVGIVIQSESIDLSVLVQLTSNDGSIAITPHEEVPNQIDLAVVPQMIENAVDVTVLRCALSTVDGNGDVNWRALDTTSNKKYTRFYYGAIPSPEPPPPPALPAEEFADSQSMDPSLPAGYVPLSGGTEADFRKMVVYGWQASSPYDPAPSSPYGWAQLSQMVTKIDGENVSYTGTLPFGNWGLDEDPNTFPTGIIVYRDPTDEFRMTRHVLFKVYVETVITCVSQDVGGSVLEERCSAPVLVPGTGAYPYPPGVTVTMSCAFPTEGVTIYYTIDDSDPSDPENGARVVYAAGVLLTGTSVINVKAVAVKTGYRNSGITMETYDLYAAE